MRIMILLLVNDSDYSCCLYYCLSEQSNLYIKVKPILYTQTYKNREPLFFSLFLLSDDRTGRSQNEWGVVSKNANQHDAFKKEKKSE